MIHPLPCTTSIGNFVAPYVKFCVDCIYINERRILGFDVFPHNWSEENNFVREEVLSLQSWVRYAESVFKFSSKMIHERKEETQPPVILNCRAGTLFRCCWRPAIFGRSTATFC